MVRNRLVVIMINIYLLVLLVAFFFKIISTGDGWTETSGRELFGVLSGIAFTCASVCVFLYSAIRLIYDRVTQDQMFYSGLYPYQIMIGKILSGAVITALFLSVTFPFVMLAYLLRGVDLVTIFASYLFAFVLIQQLNVVCLAFCAGIRSIIQGIGFGVLLIAFLIIALFFSLFLMISAMIAGGSSFLASLAFWVGMFIFLVILIIPTLIAFFIGVARLNPASFNSMFVIRVLVTIIGGMSFVLSFLIGLTSEIMVGLYIFWLFCMLAIISVMMIVGTCERETWEARIRKKIPRTRETRLLAFLFYSGSPNAMLWGASWLGVIFAANVLIFIRFTFSNNSSEEALAMFLGLTSAGVLIYNYCLTAILIRNRFLSRWVPKEATWLLVIGLMIVVCGGGVFAMFLLGSANSGLEFVNAFAFVINIPNPFGTLFLWEPYYYGSDRSYILWFTGAQVFFSLIWGLVATTYAAPWFYESFSRFTYLEEEELRPWELDRKPIIVTVTQDEFERERESEPLYRGTVPVSSSRAEIPEPAAQPPEIIETAEAVDALPVLGAFWNDEK